MGQTFSLEELRGHVEKDLSVRFCHSSQTGDTCCCVIDKHASEYIIKLLKQKTDLEPVVLWEDSFLVKSKSLGSEPTQQNVSDSSNKIPINEENKDENVPVEPQPNEDSDANDAVTTIPPISPLESRTESSIPKQIQGFVIPVAIAEGKEVIVRFIPKSSPHKPVIWMAEDTDHVRINDSNSSIFMPYTSLEQYLDQLVTNDKNISKLKSVENTNVKKPVTNGLKATMYSGKDHSTIQSDFVKTLVNLMVPHSNLNCLIQVIETKQISQDTKTDEGGFYVISHKLPLNLESVLKFSFHLINTQPKKLFLMYQLLAAVEYCHSRGITHGNLKPSNILLTKNLWLYLHGFLCPSVPLHTSLEDTPTISEALVQKWRVGELSNYEYLMALNALAKRRSGDPNMHPILPWVIDFSSANGGWRDLTKSKYRLTKGDEQLELMYNSTKYHITEPLSDLTYFHYLARRTPIPVLKKYVRFNYEPNEYPSTIQRLYHWTPDECIPEFYTNAEIFTSIHNDMPDLGIPEWASSPADLVEKHMAALESDHVSQHLHHWIDLNFGYRLSGIAAIESKNVALAAINTPSNVGSGGTSHYHSEHPRNHGFVQLFTLPHPKRLVGDSGAVRENRSFSITNSADSMGFVEISYSPRKRAGTLDSNQPQSELEVALSNLEDHERLAKFAANFDDLAPCYKPIGAPTNTEANVDLFKANDMFAVGCIMAELYSSSRRPLFNQATIPSFQTKNKLPPHIQELPPALRYVIGLLVDWNPENRPSAAMVLRSKIFPPYFEPLFDFLGKLHASKSWKDKLVLTSEKISLLLNFPEEGFDLALPFLLQFFTDCNEWDIRIAAMYLIDIIGGKLGPHKSKKYLTGPIIGLYQTHQNHFEMFSLLLSSSFVDSLKTRLGQDTLVDHFMPHFLDALRHNSVETQKLAAQLLMELGPSLGQILSLKYIAYPLFAQLPKTNCDYVIATLLAIGYQMGEQGVVEHYVPVLFNLLQRNSTRSAKGEDVLISVLKVFEGVWKIHYLISRSQLIDILTPQTTLQVFVTTSTALFVLLLNPPPSTPLLQALALTLVKISNKIGDVNVRNHVFQYVKQFLKNYDDFYKYDEKTSTVVELFQTVKGNPTSSAVLRSIYCPEMAHILYDRFKQLLGRDYLKQELTSSWSLLETLSTQHYLMRKKDNPPPKNLNSGAVLAMLARVQTSEKDKAAWINTFQCNPDTSRVWNFSGNVVNPFKGHTASVRSLAVLEAPSEATFLSGSKDQTVRIWSLEQGCKMTYQDHTHVVSDVHFMNKGSTVVSCAHAVHVWDVEKRSRLLTFDVEQGYIRTEPVRDDSVLIALDNESTLSFVDMNSARLMYAWYLPNSTVAGKIKCCAVSKDGNYLATGSSMGEMCLLDQRTGCLMAVWKAHDGPVLKLKFWNHDTLISSSHDKHLCMWNINILPPVLTKKFKGHTDPVESFDIFHNTIISVAGSKIGVASLNDEETIVTMNPTKLANTKSMKTMAILPHYQLALFGADDGLLRACN